MPFVALNDLGTRRLVPSHDFAQVFRIEPFRKRSRPHQVTEHHGQLPPLGFSSATRRRWQWGTPRSSYWRRTRTRGRNSLRLLSPHQAPAFFLSDLRVGEEQL